MVGAGGVGKTALTLRVCHDIIDSPQSGLDRIVWISLKTHYLTADGIREINDVVDSADSLIDRLLSALSSPHMLDKTPTWDRVLKQMHASKILLVIDNLETLGLDIRELAVRIPDGSKLLLTSRIGLGEIELRYQMPDLSVRDATLLLRHLGVAFNYESIRKLDQQLLKRYCEQLHYNPLLIKWFVQAVGKGARPSDILSNHEFSQALRFCWENVYQALSPLSIQVISTLLAARRSLSQTQLQELLNASYFSFTEALQELHQSNIIERSVQSDISGTYQIGSLVFDYLSRHHPPNDNAVRATRARLRLWQSEQDRSAMQANTYRYNRKAIFIATNDQRIAAPHLRTALNAIRSHGPVPAHKSLERAQELTPLWSEVYRIKAQILEYEKRPIYEIEEAFEQSLSCDSTDVTRFHYATYLLRIGEYDRALEQIEKAIMHPEADPVSLRSVRGLILTRMGKLVEALHDLEFVWEYEDAAVPLNVKRVHGTQFADTLRRRVEQLLSLGETGAAEEEALKGMTVVDLAATRCRWDHKLATVGIRLIAEITTRLDSSRFDLSEVLRFARKWDADSTFVESCKNERRTTALFARSRELTDLMKNSSKDVLVPELPMRFTGCVNRVFGLYGFIRTATIGDVYFNPNSLFRTSDWQKVSVGQRVTFAVIQEEKGPRAVRLQSDM